jgi:DivIVA domain-containing protein
MAKDRGRDFTVVLRGYDRPQVDSALDRITQLVESGQIEQARPAADGLKFNVVMRGYDRGQVDAYLEALLRR